MPEAGKLPVSAIILTRDEAGNIEDCLTCLTRVDDILIVDSGSSDDTIARATSVRSCVRVLRRAFTDFGDQRNWALDNGDIRHAWVLFVDADEFCTNDLLDEIAAFIDDPGGAVGGYIAGKNYFLGRWLRYSSYFPSYQLRLLKLGEVRFRKEGHGQREITEGRLHYFSANWRHEGFSKGVHQWIARHNDYSTNEIELIGRLRQEPLKWSDLSSRSPVDRRRMLKRLAARLPGRPILRFVYTYVIRRGFLDGYPGLVFCLLRLAHDCHITAKLAERR